MDITPKPQQGPPKFSTARIAKDADGTFRGEIYATVGTMVVGHIALSAGSLAGAKLLFNAFGAWISQQPDIAIVGGNGKVS